ncbi:hypothetical protein [Pseudoalteromonas sp. OOF1S-7]|uniref:hypothetical protein n=1 Tax=Pseudoalteromonas sp. OOF1S-7 TaxID=2917757 RepID=UPI001EF60E94|nr:hypothetical protein [Pseudoalteromonas sp. OOF1S-7]MCG7536523.1 hypothetical protein [Pseudoalteromonas sp. OOF1S-7]
MLTLNKVMRANAISCLMFGLVFVVGPELTATFLGGDTPPPSLAVLGLGILLILNGLHLLWASALKPSSNYLVYYFSAGDFLWVFASMSLVFTQVWITTTEGIVATVLVAGLVAAFAVLQLFHKPSRRITNES